MTKSLIEMALYHSKPEIGYKGGRGEINYIGYLRRNILSSNGVGPVAAGGFFFPERKHDVTPAERLPIKVVSAAILVNDVVAALIPITMGSNCLLSIGDKFAVEFGNAPLLSPMGVSEAEAARMEDAIKEIEGGLVRALADVIEFTDKLANEKKAHAKTKREFKKKIKEMEGLLLDGAREREERELNEINADANMLKRIEVSHQLYEASLDRMRDNVDDTTSRIETFKKFAVQSACMSNIELSIERGNHFLDASLVLGNCIVDIDLVDGEKSRSVRADYTFQVPDINMMYEFRAFLNDNLPDRGGYD